jgi:acetyl esterase
MAIAYKYFVTDPAVAAQVDPCFAAMLADPRTQLRPPSSIPAFRDAFEVWFGSEKGPPVHAVESLLVDEPLNPVPLRLYRPSAEPGLPVVVFLHGGGWVVGSLDTHDSICRELALRSGAAVLSVGYRRAPECPFPGPLEDCYSALGWAHRRAAGLGLDARRIALCGDSAGGNLAAATAILARERAAPVASCLRHLGLIYPAIDPGCESESARQFADGYLLTRESMHWFWNCYLNGGQSAAAIERTERPAYLAAVMHADPAGLPATTVLTAEFDPLRDEGETFAQHLQAAGVPVVSRRYAGMLHGFVSLPSLTPAAGQAIADLAGDLAASLELRPAAGQASASLQ